eukprot:TRINITY_DN3768_c0_g3_i1.p1 TRINITY_DN3768_c0_g3~~TRINITY_DN3768_c0_g3_i1.p1  ORF type:complete len:664 (+),score=107.75 TRINITY_DN3768_c0_g3_i1:239-2230(+)
MSEQNSHSTIESDDGSYDGDEDANYDGDEEGTEGECGSEKRLLHPNVAHQRRRLRTSTLEDSTYSNNSKPFLLEDLVSYYPYPTLTHALRGKKRLPSIRSEPWRGSLNLPTSSDGTLSLASCAVKVKGGGGSHIISIPRQEVEKIEEAPDTARRRSCSIANPSMDIKQGEGILAEVDDGVLASKHRRSRRAAITISNEVDNGEISNFISPVMEISDSSDPEQKPLEAFLKVLLDPKMAVIQALTSVINESDFDEFATSLVCVFATHRLDYYLLRWAFRLEISKTKTETTLFRSTDIASRLLSLHCKNWGLSYLFRLVDPTIESLLLPTLSLELDQSKLTPTDGMSVENILEINQKRTIKILDQLIADMENSVDSFPLPLRMIFKLLQEETIKKFPSMKYKVICGIFFLRFVSPALASPESFFPATWREKVPVECRRRLVIVSKILQNIGNEILFDEKESHLVFLNEFIKEKQPQLHRFIDRLLVVEWVDEPELNPKFAKMYEPSLVWVIDQICTHKEKLAQTMLRDSQIATFDEWRSTLNFFNHINKQNFEKDPTIHLTTVLQDISRETLDNEIKTNLEDVQRSRKARVLVRQHSIAMQKKLEKRKDNVITGSSSAGALVTKENGFRVREKKDKEKEKEKKKDTVVVSPEKKEKKKRWFQKLL